MFSLRKSLGLWLRGHLAEAIQTDSDRQPHTLYQLYTPLSQPRSNSFGTVNSDLVAHRDDQTEHTTKQRNETEHNCGTG